MLLASLLLATAPSLPTVRYRVTCDPPAAADPKWRVEIVVAGLDPKRRDVRQPQFFRDFMKEEGGVVRRATFEKWLAAQGLEEAWASCCRVPFVPDPRADLLRAGFRPVERADPNDPHHVATALGGTTEPFFRFGK